MLTHSLHIHGVLQAIDTPSDSLSWSEAVIKCQLLPIRYACWKDWGFWLSGTVTGRFIVSGGTIITGTQFSLPCFRPVLKSHFHMDTHTLRR